MSSGDSSSSYQPRAIRHWILEAGYWTLLSHAFNGFRLQRSSILCFSLNASIRQFIPGNFPSMSSPRGWTNDSGEAIAVLSLASKDAAEDPPGLVTLDGAV